MPDGIKKKKRRVPTRVATTSATGHLAGLYRLPEPEREDRQKQKTLLLPGQVPEPVDRTRCARRRQRCQVVVSRPKLILSINCAQVLPPGRAQV